MSNICICCIVCTYSIFLYIYTCACILYMPSVSKRLQCNLWRGGLHLKYRLIHGPELVIFHKHSIVVVSYVFSSSVYVIDEGVGHTIAVYR